MSIRKNAHRGTHPVVFVVISSEGNQAVNVARRQHVVVFAEPHACLHRVVDLPLVQLPLGKQVIVVGSGAAPRVIEHLKRRRDDAHTRETKDARKKTRKIKITRKIKNNEKNKRKVEKVREERMC